MSSAVSSDHRPWWKELHAGHWFVFTIAALGWLFDCLDQQLFILARTPAIETLLKLQGITDSSTVKEYAGYATAIFIMGWATGGLIFGSLGDRFGRAKMLAMTVLLYSLFTGLSAFSRNVTDFCIFRFITGLGVGGVFGLAVALVADSLPDRARPSALGVLQALSAVGNITAGLVAMFVASLNFTSLENWRFMFLVGAVPAFLCVFIQFRLKEPEKWVKAREQGRVSGVKLGSYFQLFGDARWRKSALLGMLLCVAGVIGLWGIGFFSPELVGDVITKMLKERGLSEAEMKTAKMTWIGINSIMQNIGAFLGMLVFTRFATQFGRKPIFALAYLAAFASTFAVFKFLSQPWHIFTLIPLMGFCQLAIFAGFAIYLPELFPTSLRSTGTSFCYNVGRFLAASGPFTLGLLQAKLAAGAGAANPDAKLEAFRNACCWLSCVFLLGLVALIFLPETKDRPLPE